VHNLISKKMVKQ